jgi:hypothetical protein
MGTRTTAGHIMAILAAWTATCDALAAEGEPPSLDARLQLTAEQMPASDRPLVTRAELGTNSGNTTRDVALLSEAEGVRQILSFTEWSALEEQWAYLPGPGLWVEVGVNEDVGRHGPQVEGDSEYLAHLISAFDRVHLYHFHPQRYFAEGAADATVYALAASVDGLTPDARAAIALALPSPTDVWSSANLAVMHEQLNPDGEVRNFVVSPYGIIEYQPTEDGRRKLATEFGHPLARTMRDLTTLAAIRRAPFNIERTIGARRGLAVSELISTLCEQVSGPDYTMRYATFDGATD